MSYLGFTSKEKCTHDVAQCVVTTERLCNIDVGPMRGLSRKWSIGESLLTSLFTCCLINICQTTTNEKMDNLKNMPMSSFVKSVSMLV